MKRVSIIIYLSQSRPHGISVAQYLARETVNQNILVLYLDDSTTILIIVLGK